VVRLVLGRAGRADVVVPRVGEHLEPMHALYAKTCLPHIEARLKARRLKIAEFFEDVRVEEISEREVAPLRTPEIVFMNVNTPDELARARALAAEMEGA
jgi:molybdopterin-guanine dinucleotide biosynthesis protein A